MQDHTHNNGVPAEPLPDLLRLLLLQRAHVHPAAPAHLLGGAHRAHGHQVPARQRRGRRFFSLPNRLSVRASVLPQPTTTLGCLIFLCLQDIVEDERSDKEETESDEDEGGDGKRKTKPANGHVRNGHTPLNNNHSKKD